MCSDQSFATATAQAVEGAAKRQKVPEEEVARAKSMQEEAIDATNEVDVATRQGPQAGAPQSWGPPGRATKATRQDHQDRLGSGPPGGPPRPPRQWPARQGHQAMAVRQEPPRQGTRQGLQAD